MFTVQMCPFSYYNGLIRFLAECKEKKGPLQKPPTRNKDEWPKIEEV